MMGRYVNGHYVDSKCRVLGKIDALVKFWVRHIREGDILFRGHSVVLVLTAFKKC